jgi:hypothetical protein
LVPRSEKLLSRSLHHESCREFLFAYGSFFFVGTETE